MNSSHWDLASSAGPAVVILPVVGLVVVVVLVAAVVWGRRSKAAGARPPRPEEQPRLPEGGPVGEVMEEREPNEVPRQEHSRLNPTQLSGTGTSPVRPADPKDSDGSGH